MDISTEIKVNNNNNVVSCYNFFSAKIEIMFRFTWTHDTFTTQTIDQSTVNNLMKLKSVLGGKLYSINILSSVLISIRAVVWTAFVQQSLCFLSLQYFDKFLEENKTNKNKHETTTITHR